MACTLFVRVRDENKAVRGWCRLGQASQPCTGDAGPTLSLEGRPPDLQGLAASVKELSAFWLSVPLQRAPP